MAVCVYSFDRLHSAAVESGQKTRTIRKAGRRRHASVGDPVRLFEGLRTARSRLLAEGVCTSRSDVKLRFSGGALIGASVAGRRVANLHEFAARDGFSDVREMARFFEKWNGAGDFEGVMIEWRLE